MASPKPLDEPQLERQVVTRKTAAVQLEDEVSVLLVLGQELVKSQPIPSAWVLLPPR